MTIYCRFIFSTMYRQSATGIYLYIENEQQYLSSLRRCHNYSKGCLVKFKSDETLRKHELKCKTVAEAQENPIIIQQSYDACEHPLEQLKSDGWIDQYPQNRNFLIYDIESTLMSSNNAISEKQTIKDNHKLLSIGASSYINGEHTERVWVITESTEAARMDIVEDFLRFCVGEAARMEIDPQLNIVYQQMQIEMSAHKFFDPIRARLGVQLYELGQFLMLPIFGYNSARYDMQMLSKYIIPAITKLEVYFLKHITIFSILQYIVISRHISYILPYMHMT